MKSSGVMEKFDNVEIHSYNMAIIVKVKRLFFNYFKFLKFSDAFIKVLPSQNLYCHLMLL